MFVRGRRSDCHLWGSYIYRALVYGRVEVERVFLAGWFGWRYRDYVRW